LAADITTHYICWLTSLTQVWLTAGQALSCAFLPMLLLCPAQMPGSLNPLVAAAAAAAAAADAAAVAAAVTHLRKRQSAICCT
jgi:hypothetical protein